MNKRTNKNYKRIQFEFHTNSVARLDSLVDKTESANRTEVVKKALQMYEFVLNEVENGKKFILKDDQDDSESLILSFAL